MKADHQSKQYRLEDQLLKYFPEEIEKHKEMCIRDRCRPCLSAPMMFPVMTLPDSSPR